METTRTVSIINFLGSVAALIMYAINPDMFMLILAAFCLLNGCVLWGLANTQRDLAKLEQWIREHKSTIIEVHNKRLKEELKKERAEMEAYYNKQK